MADVTMEPWWWVSTLTVALPVYLALRRRRNIWAIIAACLLGLALGAILEGGFFAADTLTTGETFIFADAVAKALDFPKNFFTGLLFIVAGALNPELLFLLPRVIEDILAGAASSNLGRLEISLRAFGLIATIIVPLVAAIHGHRTVRWLAIVAGSVAITAARIGAGYLHNKDQGIVVIRNEAPWVAVLYDINWSIVALFQTFIQICLVYFVLRALHYLVRLIGAGSRTPSPK